MLQTVIGIGVVYWIYRSYKRSADQEEPWATRLEDKARRVVKIIREKPGEPREDGKRSRPD